MKCIAILASVVIIAGSCQSSSPAKAEETPVLVTNKSEGENLISFKVNGKLVNTSGWTISRFSFQSEPLQVWLNITSNMKQEPRTLNINLNGSVPGKYSLGGSAMKKQSHASYYPNYIEDLSHSFSFSSGEFTITQVDTVKHLVNGYFSGIVKNLNGEQLEITDGKLINGALNRNVIRY
jgi:hypothetical protein